MADILREQTESEQKDFKSIVSTDLDAETSFKDELNKEKVKMARLKKPFADKAILSEWTEHYESEVKRIVREKGFVDVTKIKQFKVDFSKYSDLKNFELIEEGEARDDYLSKRLNKEVFSKFKKYKFKGYYHTYTLMEDPQ